MTTDNKTASDAATSKGNNVGANGALATDGGSESGSQRLSADVPAGSRLAHLKAQRDERLKKEELTLAVPTWKGGLVATFRPMSIDERKDFAARMSGKDFDEVTVGAEFVATCCIGLKIREEDGSFVEAKDEHGKPHLMDAAFAESLGYAGIKTGAGCFQELVNWNPAAVEGVFEKLHDWSQDTSKSIEGAILGE